MDFWTSSLFQTAQGIQNVDQTILYNVHFSDVDLTGQIYSILSNQHYHEK